MESQEEEEADKKEKHTRKSFVKRKYLAGRGFHSLAMRKNKPWTFTSSLLLGILSDWKSLTSRTPSRIGTNSASSHEQHPK